MLACLQRRQNPAPQHATTTCSSSSSSSSSSSNNSSINLQATQHINHKCEPTISMPSPRYPSAAQLDAYAQKMASRPLSIKIFPTNIRVPQHKHLNRTVNGYITGQHYSPYPHIHTGGYQGLLAIVRVSSSLSSSSFVPSTKGVLKNSEGKRTKLSPAQIALTPYPPPNSSTLAHCHGQIVYQTGPPKSLEAKPNATVAGSIINVAGGRGLNLPPQSNLPSIQSIIYQINQHCQAQALQQVCQNGMSKGPLSPSPSKGTISISGGTYVTNVAPQGNMAYSGMVLPGLNVEVMKAGVYPEGTDYTLCQKQQQAVLRMYSGGSGGEEAVSKSPETCGPGGSIMLGGTQIYSSIGYPMTASTSDGDGLDKFSSSPLNDVGMHGNFSVGQYFVPPWNSVLVMPDNDCYNPRDLPGATTTAGPVTGHKELGFTHHHHHHHHPPIDSMGALCCSLPSKSLFNTSVLSSSLQSLEYLINDIHPPCIKEQMLGKGYETVPVPRLLDHQHVHFRLPVKR